MFVLRRLGECDLRLSMVAFFQATADREEDAEGYDKQDGKHRHAGEGRLSCGEFDGLTGQPVGDGFCAGGINPAHTSV